MNNKVKGDVKMTKIKIMSVRDEDMPYIKASLVMMAYRYHNKYHYQSMFIND